MEEADDKDDDEEEEIESASQHEEEPQPKGKGKGKGKATAKPKAPRGKKTLDALADAAAARSRAPQVGPSTAGGSSAAVPVEKTKAKPRAKRAPPKSATIVIDEDPTPVIVIDEDPAPTATPQRPIAIPAWI